MEQQASPDSSNPPAPPPSAPNGWYGWNGKLVVLQLREPYVGITHPAKICRSEDSSPIATSLLRGQLFVTPGDPGTVLLVLVMPDPQIDKKSKVYVTLQPRDVQYCTCTEQEEAASRIVVP